MKIYLASSWRNPKQQIALAALRHAGHEVYDFRHPRPDNHGFHWSAIDPSWRAWTGAKFRDALDHPIAVDGYALDFDALKAADACVLLLPCGRSAHLEAGWAAGAGKPLLVVLSDECEPELMYRMATSLCLHLDEVLSELQRLERKRMLA